MRLLGGATPKKRFKVVRLEALEGDVERGKPLFRRKGWKTRNLDGSGHKGLADFSFVLCHASGCVHKERH